MSIDICFDCSRWIDTDLDDECYIESEEFPICSSCREADSDE